MNRYALVERERRFLLKQLPSGLDQSTFTLIEDVYITDTRLRLRKMTLPDGSLSALKLGHKLVAPGQQAHEIMMTNFYLDDAEFALLATLPGRQLVKKRFQYPWNGRTFGIDQFQNELEGLILAEVEALSDDDLMAIPVPDFAIREVTNEIAFTGGELVKGTAVSWREELT